MEESTNNLSRDVVAASPLAAEAATTLRGRRLIVLRALWATVSIATLSLYVVVWPWIFAQLRAEWRADGTGGRAIEVFIFALPWVYFVVAAVIFWLKSDDWMALFVSLALLTFGVVIATFDTSSLNYLFYSQPIWRVLFTCVRTIGWGSFLIFFLLFPNGQFVPRWTRWLALGWAVYILLWIPFPVLNPDTGNGTLGILLLSGCLITGMLAQIYRYRRASSSIERQQTKWVMFGCTSAGLGAIVVATILIAGMMAEARSIGLGSLEDYLWYILMTILLLAILLVPVSIGIAVLRYRLWEINPLINRTLVYGVLTIALVLIYVTSVVLLQQVFRAFTSGSDLAIVTSTLATVALFTPLHRRIQKTIDKRFYRRKYDAAKVLAAFAVRLQHETDLDTLTVDLLQVMDETMQPAHANLWIRGPKHEP